MSGISIPTTTAVIAKTRGLTHSPSSRAATSPALEKAANEAQVIGESQNFTRDLVNEPSNRMTPTILADRAKKMCAEVGLKCEVYGADKIKEMKMGAFWSVAQGSDEPPALIVMRYEPAGAPEKPVLGLVGKGITFDTGGISIKPADGMEKMKYDMAGGATMIGAMRAIALLKPKVKVIGIVCATENMPSGKAQKPGDVQIAMSGKSIEIINTDAEGRLVLADGLFYARQLGCTHLVDAATLTGAVVVALGYNNAGIFANDDDMYNRFHSANAKAGEKMWRMPLDDEYKEQIRSVDRRHRQLRRTLGRRDHRGHVPERVRRRHSVDSSRHRRHRVDGRSKAMDRERSVGHSAAQSGGVREEFRGIRTRLRILPGVLDDLVPVARVQICALITVSVRSRPSFCRRKKKRALNVEGNPRGCYNRGRSARSRQWSDFVRSRIPPQSA